MQSLTQAFTVVNYNTFTRTNALRNNTNQGAVAGAPGTMPTNWSDVTT